MLEYTGQDQFLKYEGQVKDGKPQGRGNMIFKDEGFYFGEWQDGLRQGQGSQKYSSASERLSYDGFWKDNKEDGYGRIVYKNKEKYEGNMISGLREGIGLLTYAENDSQNRSKYSGEWKVDKTSGQGTLIYKTSEKYIGEWLNNLRHGHGIMSYAENDEWNRISYDGEWKEGKKTGKGKFVWKNGGNFVGEWLNGLRHGHGVETYPENDKWNRISYDGEWKDGERTGNGTFIWKNRGKYVGAWLNGWKHGHGVETYPENDQSSGIGSMIWQLIKINFLPNNLKNNHGVTNIAHDGDNNEISYDGEWKKGQYSGEGTLIYKTGRKYIGELLNNFRHGHGIMSYAENDEWNRISYDGEWKEGKITGKGTFIWKNGEKYVGEWLNNLRHGHGVETYPENDSINRISYDGEWKGDMRSGQGTLTWKSGEKYIGKWLNDSRHGQGLHINGNKVSNQGRWENDTFIG